MPRVSDPLLSVNDLHNHFGGKAPPTPLSLAIAGGAPVLGAKAIPALKVWKLFDEIVAIFRDLVGGDRAKALTGFLAYSGQGREASNAFARLGQGPLMYLSSHVHSKRKINPDWQAQHLLRVVCPISLMFFSFLPFARRLVALDVIQVANKAQLLQRMNQILSYGWVSRFLAATNCFVQSRRCHEGTPAYIEAAAKCRLKKEKYKEILRTQGQSEDNQQKINDLIAQYNKAEKKYQDLAGGSRGTLLGESALLLGAFRYFLEGVEPWVKIALPSNEMWTIWAMHLIKFVPRTVSVYGVYATAKNDYLFLTWELCKGREILKAPEPWNRMTTQVEASVNQLKKDRSFQQELQQISSEFSQLNGH